MSIGDPRQGDLCQGDVHHGDLRHGDLRGALLLHGFVLSQRPSEVLLTFPELLELPEGLEPEACATVRYLARSGPFAAVARVARVAAGPPVTLTFKRLAPVRVGDGLGAQRPAAGPPVSIHVVSSRVAPSSAGAQAAAGVVQDMSDESIVVITPVLLAVGDTLRLSVDGHSGGGQSGV
ncbi:MAG: hypothetical protein ABSB49_19710, partial [Polyangia bacterium]